MFSLRIFVCERYQRTGLQTEIFGKKEKKKERKKERKREREKRKKERKYVVNAQ